MSDVECEQDVLRKMLAVSRSQAGLLADQRRQEAVNLARSLSSAFGVEIVANGERVMLGELRVEFTTYGYRLTGPDGRSVMFQGVSDFANAVSVLERTPEPTVYEKLRRRVDVAMGFSAEYYSSYEMAAMCLEDCKALALIDIAEHLATR